MTTLTVCDETHSGTQVETTADPSRITAILSAIGVGYERRPADIDLPGDAARVRRCDSRGALHAGLTVTPRRRTTSGPSGILPNYF
jgi:hypothetical protein